LADVALANRVISSHYAEPVEVVLTQAATFRVAASADSETIGELAAGDSFRLVDCKLGWAWGYAGPDGRVGYVPAEAVGLG
jgi:hypothetical protein